LSCMLSGQQPAPAPLAPSGMPRPSCQGAAATARLRTNPTPNTRGYQPAHCSPYSSHPVPPTFRPPRSASTALCRSWSSRGGGSSTGTPRCPPMATASASQVGTRAAAGQGSGEAAGQFFRDCEGKQPLTNGHAMHACWWQGRGSGCPAWVVQPTLWRLLCPTSLPLKLSALPLAARLALLQ